MLSKEGISLSDLENGLFSKLLVVGDSSEVPFLKRDIGSGSGGYADNIFLHAAREIFNEEIKNLTYKTLR